MAYNNIYYCHNLFDKLKTEKKYLIPNKRYFNKCDILRYVPLFEVGIKLLAELLFKNVNI